ncbi:MAG: c-type cytochrome, partial [Bryobacteraceae bacterium]
AVTARERLHGYFQTGSKERGTSRFAMRANRRTVGVIESLLPMRTAALLVLLMSQSMVVEAQTEPHPDGQSLFYSNCAVCHGADGAGGCGSNLLGRLQNGDRDADIANVVQHGVPGTSMPAFQFEKDELAALVKHILTLRHGAPSPPPPGGDRVAGRLLYRSRGCAGCHRIGEAGSTLGPDLTRVGAGRSYEFLKTSVLDPSAEVPDEYEAITIVTRDGKRIRGIRVNEDTFTIQMRLPDESFVSFDKRAVRSVVHETKSFMPSYRFSGNDLRNLLAYLSSLRGGATASGVQQQPRLH